MRIVFADDASIILDSDMDFSSVAKHGEYVAYPNSTEAQLVERARDAQVIVVNKVPVSAAVINAASQLKLITVIAAGYNNVDLEAARGRGVTVCNVAGYAAHTVPQHAFALILNLATQAYRYYADVMAGKWATAEGFTLLSYPTFELKGRIIGIVGFGSIGRGVARIAEAFQMKVLASDAMGINDPQYANTDLDILLAQADVVTVHTPLTPETKHIINAAALAKMKPTALLINTARGGIVDEQALADALNNDRLAGAGFDVLTEEPPVSGNPLLKAKNIIITPHSAWSTREARQTLVDETGKNIEAFLAGTARNVVS